MVAGQARAGGAVRGWPASCTGASRAGRTPLVWSSQLGSHLIHTAGGYPAFFSAVPCPVPRPRVLHAIHRARGTRYFTCYLLVRHLAKNPKYPGRLPQPCPPACPHSLVQRQPDPFVSPCTDQRSHRLFEYHHDQPSSPTTQPFSLSAGQPVHEEHDLAAQAKTSSRDPTRCHHVVSMPSYTIVPASASASASASSLTLTLTLTFTSLSPHLHLCLHRLAVVFVFISRGPSSPC